jgi:hypothetical protein
MGRPGSDTDEQTAEADRRNGEPGTTGEDDRGAQQHVGEHDDADLDQHPHDGEMPSDYGVQAERQEPLS